MENQKLINAGIYGGIIAALFNATPILNFVNCFCCAGIIAGGAVGMIVYDHTQEEKVYFGTPTAVTVGLVTGIFGAFISLLFEWIFYQVFGDWQLELVQKMMENMDEVPEYISETVREMEDAMSYGFMWASVLIRNLLVIPVFSLAGALLMRLFLIKNRSVE